MIEIKVKMQKDNVIKEIPENLVSEYSFMGWSKVEEKEEPKFEKKSFGKKD